MRELKFRIWDTRNKTMCTVYHLEWTDGKLWAHCIPHLKDIRRILNTEKNPLMQYTGIKDSAKKEIYEGDILQFEHDGEKLCAGAVKWREEVAIWAVDIGIGLTTIEPEDAWVPDAYEVIGNIHESPELLDK